MEFRLCGFIFRDLFPAHAGRYAFIKNGLLYGHSIYIVPVLQIILIVPVLQIILKLLRYGFALSMNRLKNIR